MPQKYLQIKKSIRVFGPVGAIFGFTSDLLQPIAPFSSYIFFATALTTVTIGIAVILKSTLRTKGIPALMFSGFMMVTSGFFYTFQDENNKNSGVIASAVPGISKLQSSLGIIKGDISEIKKSAKRIEESTARTEELVEKVEQNTDENVEETRKVAEAVRESTQAIVGSLQDIQKGFTTLAQSGGMIVNPKRPEQFYHNARVQELAGDYVNARRSYNRYFTFKLDFIDPHLRYQTFLKVQEGKSGAREIYSAMYENDQRPIMEFARIILFDSPQRTKMLEEFVSKKPNFGFAYLELSKEFSELRTGVSTIKNLRKEYDYLVKFMDLYKKGTIARLFLDKARLSELVSTVESRIKILEASLKKTENPVYVSAYPEIKRYTTTTRVTDVDAWRSSRRESFKTQAPSFPKDKYVDTTILKTAWKISLQIFENAEDPKIDLVNGESKKSIAVESQSSSLKTSMFHFFIKDEEFGGNSFLAVSYLNSLGETSGPHKVLLSKEDYIISFLKKISAEGQDLEVTLSKKSAGIPGFPFAHLLDLSKKYVKNYTYLQIAAKKNYIHVAKWLLKNGANVNNGFRGSQPLIIAVLEKNYDFIKLLIAHGADPNVGARDYYTPLFLADKKDTELNRKIVKILVGAGAKKCTPLGYLSPDGRTAEIKGKPDDCNLKNKDLATLDLKKTNLKGVNLKERNLKRRDLAGVDLTGADLSSANLSEAKLSGANLNNVDLSGANLNNIDLSGANLSRANLSRADLTGANLTKAKLSDANLRGATLTGINLTEVVLNKANLCNTKMPSGKLESRDCK
jgi:hypothetical protein